MARLRFGFVLLLFVSLLLGQSVQAADLAANLCQDAHKVTDEKMCQGLLIGTIDSLYGLGEYCPDGATSYGLIIETWMRLLKKQPTLKSQPTIITMRRAMAELSLVCGK
jgi:hypothetical protein